MENLRSIQDKALLSASRQSSHRRFGLWLFAVYLALYAGFIGVAAFGHGALSKPTIFGFNWAIFYGFTLIASAFVLALVFLVAGQNQERR